MVAGPTESAGRSREQLLTTVDVPVVVIEPMTSASCRSSWHAGAPRQSKDQTLGAAHRACRGV